MFLRMSGSQIQTRPIKGTRPRHPDATRDAQFSYELQTSAKEISELVMITDLLRNDLGRVCEFGSVQVPDLVRLERYPHVYHLVSTIEGRLRPDRPGRCATPRRLERLVRERGLRETEAMDMIVAQMPAELKRARADFVIDNVGTLAQLDARVAEVWSALEQAAELTASPAFEG